MDSAYWWPKEAGHNSRWGPWDRVPIEMPFIHLYEAVGGNSIKVIQSKNVLILKYAKFRELEKFQ